MAFAISELLKNPNLPDVIYEGIKDGMCGLENKIDFNEISYEPKYIEKVFELAGYDMSRGEE